MKELDDQIRDLKAACRDAQYRRQQLFSALDSIVIFCNNNNGGDDRITHIRALAINGIKESQTKYKPNQQWGE